MDYGASADTEALHGSSPWGSSSPRANRTTFAPSEPSAPSTPALPPSAHAHTNSQDSISANPFANEPPRSQPDQQTQASSNDAEEQSTEQPSQPPQPRQESLRPAQPRQQNVRQHRTVPAYKLQAKVTALERTGRKDPVIRFDVYVCASHPLYLQR